MESLWLGWTSTFATVATITAVISFCQYLSNIQFRKCRGVSTENQIATKESNQETAKAHETLEAKVRDADDIEAEDLKAVKVLYYKLHSLEKFPDALQPAKRLLISLLKETSAAARLLPEHESILSIRSFSRENLEKFQRKRNRQVGQKWEQYNIRRDEGGARELFEDREEAIWWLKQIAPVKYVDGAWLGHIGKVTTPFALRKTIKGAWQILSEELGDGDLGKNHVHVYHKLLEDLAPGLPTAEMLDFGHPRHQLEDLSVWKAGIAQLLVSLFPHEFLPEILGFNLHFEAISLDTLKAGKELKEVGIDPYYFILHISIDNAHSGHSAIAIEIVCEYMEYVRRVEGEEAAQKAWEKIQAGYLLSSHLPGTTVSPSRRKPVGGSEVQLSPIESEVMRLFKAKADVVHGIHCCSRIRIGSRSIADWLDPVALESKTWQRGLLNALSCSKYWIRRGDSANSRFMRELQWNGRMFGSFTQDEYNVLKNWVDNLPSISLVLEGPYTKQNSDDKEDILSGYPVFAPPPCDGIFETLLSSTSATALLSFQSLPSLDIGKRPIVENFFPLWLSHACLLQGFVTVPFMTRSTFACTVVKVLRAQGGFDIEQECVAGMCEVRRPNSLGLIEIGTNMMAQHGVSLIELPSLKYVLQVWPSEFAINMLQFSMRPMKYKGLLIGMATAFAKMHVAIARFPPSLLSMQDQSILQRIGQRELEGMELCWKELEQDGEMYDECCKGYLIAENKVKKCFAY